MDLDKLIDLGRSDIMNFDKTYSERINSYAWSLAASYKKMMMLAETIIDDPEHRAQKIECAQWAYDKCNHYCNELMSV